MPNNPTLDPGGKFSVDENELPAANQRLSRSPHPYHRQGDQIRQSSLVVQAQSVRGRSDLTPNTSQKLSSQYITDYFDADSRKRRKIATSSSDSGTEADDERPLLLKGLPAPNTKPRKGLRAVRGQETDPMSSPFLTPSQLDERRGSLTAGSGFENRISVISKGRANVGIAHIRDKNTRRRRAELIRRLLEAVILATVGYISLKGSKGDMGTEVLFYLVLVIGLYATFFFRILWHRRSKIYNGNWIYSNFRVPVVYDPAPLLYPVFLPSLMAVSLATNNLHFVLSNLVLGICSLPKQIIPLYNYDYSLHWLVSLLPSILFNDTSLNYNLNDQGYTPNHELLALLFPLHWTLLPTLGFLSTTSLLPAELQLLSVALINLLLFSTSPQASVLKALLWIGGITLFVLCRRVLQWTVELARVPSWRFKRSRHASQAKSVLFRAVDDSTGGLLSTKCSPKKVSNSSGSDCELRPQSLAICHKSHQHFLPHKVGMPQRAEEPAINDTVNTNGNSTNSNIEALHLKGGRYRSHSLSGYLAGSPSRPSLLRPKSFLTLTSAQATVLKWLYSFYVYFTVVATIAIPIRSYIGHWALNNNEPVGWALGYLLGDNTAFRLQTLMWNLESWICLPPRAEDSSQELCYGEEFRQIMLGSANTRLLICGYCIACITAGLAVVFWLTAVVEVDTRRKVFHGMMVLMFLPTIFLDPTFVALAFSLILAIFLLLDLFRASQLPPVSKPLTYFLAPYVDGRDHRGPIIVSHIFLLIGCAIPLWLSLTSTERSGAAPFEGWEVQARDLSMISGIVCVGMGDAAASLIGRRYGRRRWPWSGGKSLEGTVAFAIAVVLGIVVARAWLLIGGWAGDSGDRWVMTVTKAAVAALGASLTEAVLTGGNDNVIVPLILWLLVRGMKI